MEDILFVYSEMNIQSQSSVAMVTVRNHQQTCNMSQSTRYHVNITNVCLNSCDNNLLYAHLLSGKHETFSLPNVLILFRRLH